ncbi:hypothetical protein TVAG_307980 [Trichomonas vaginalis G3]|uniref:Spliceosomal protein DIB1 n=1 Tax=Trichomonas vaginalis (strain ATCC PRA-98 / G3) TaxID=412133 RepID=A2EGJ7_TRIV3|nr:spliceosomal complex assembly [Trichomonas vaginalis G3]EAY08192.1 hypothetical protein TVAG_307980 [Trichomonas vaginalis G3]KAI5519765.1 spliceosomal complex assembly [Trichomonas vaginalis G3]|eukprot:XP_001320415.1 hypothetical protein [Trichomonas vaginalis G3]
MSFLLTHLPSGWDVDQAIVWEKTKLVCIRFGRDTDPMCMKMDQMLASCAEKLKNFVVIYAVDIIKVPDFNKMYELVDPCSVMFFFKNRHITVDYGTGENNKMNFLLKTKQEFIDICEIVYRAASKGLGTAKSIINYANTRNRGKVEENKKEKKPLV